MPARLHLPDFEAAKRTARPGIPDAMRRGFEAWQADALKRLKRATPRDTGRLRRRTTAKRKGRVATFEARTQYASFLEFARGGRHEYMGRSIARSARTLPRYIDREFKALDRG